MRVTVEGVITSIEQDVKRGSEGNPDKKITKLLLAQKGEKQQVEVRLPGHVEKEYDLFHVQAFNGRLLSWKTRDGVGMMVSIAEEE